METKKRKYVKPKLTVAEWDFNEAVCQSQTFCISKCIQVEASDSKPNRYLNITDQSDWNGITWKDYPQGRN